MPDMAQPPKKRPFVPSELDRQRASDLERKADELGQPAVATILGVGVRTLQRYIKLQRSMRAQHVDRFEQHFGRSPFSSAESAHQSADAAPLNESRAALERVLSMRRRDLSYAQAEDLRDFAKTSPALTEEQWDKIVNTILNGRKAAT